MLSYEAKVVAMWVYREVLFSRGWSSGGRSALKTTEKRASLSGVYRYLRNIGVLRGRKTVPPQHTISRFLAKAELGTPARDSQDVLLQSRGVVIPGNTY